MRKWQIVIWIEGVKAPNYSVAIRKAEMLKRSLENQGNIGYDRVKIAEVRAF